MSGPKMLYQEYGDLTVFQMLQKLEDRFGARTLFSYRLEEEVRTVSYRGFVRDVRRLAAYFDRLGLRGRRVVIDGRNTYEQVAALFAAAAMGAVAVPLCFDLQLEDLRDLLRRLAPAAVLYDAESADTIRELAPDLPMGLIPCMGAAGEGSLRGVLDGEGPLYQDGGRCAPGDPALILATSGSTSRSKLVVLSHYALIPHIRVDVQRTICVLPLYHCGAICMLANDMGLGIPVCLSSLRRGLFDMQWYHPSDIFAVPSFIALMVKRSRMGKLDLSGLRFIGSGGAAQDLSVSEYLDSLGIFYASLYGATETIGAVGYTTPEEYRAGSVGRTAPWNEVKISEQGEILVRGKNVMLEYLDDPEATRAALEGGWYHTGDTGYIDGDGFLFITGRIKNIIVLSNGENVSPEAVESKLAVSGDIEEVVVRSEGDRIVAHIWCGADAEEDKRERVRACIRRYNREVPTYQMVRGAIFREEPFEKTPSGKIKRQGLL